MMRKSEISAVLKRQYNKDSRVGHIDSYVEENSKLLTKFVYENTDTENWVKTT